MSLFALIVALLLEQLHPLSSRKYLYGWLNAYVNFFYQHFNSGEHQHGKIAWLLAVIPLLAGVVTLYILFYHEAHPIIAWAFNVLVLYLTMGFRQFSHYFTNIHQALRKNKLEEARTILTRWCGINALEFDAEKIARVTIEQALIASHRNVFGVIVWFVLFSVLGLGGAAGALLYRLGQFLSSRWGMEDNGEFGGFAQQAFYVLEWLPIRLTAMTFAIVGNFEDTVYCWRSQAASWPDPEAGILLASGAGALGVRLGMPVPQGGLPFDRPDLGIGDVADADFMQSAVGLVWRSVVFWIILLMLLTLASLLG